MDDIFGSLFPAITMLVLIIAIYALIGIGALANYILRAIGILRISEVHGLQNGWLGFIPFASEYQLGKIAGEVEAGKRRIKKTALWMLLLPAITYGVFFTAYFIFLFSIVNMAVSSNFHSFDGSGAFLLTGGIIGMIVVYLFLIVGSIFYVILYALAMHKILCRFYAGQQPVFHLVLCLFVPFAEAIILFNLAKKPMIQRPEYWPEYPAQSAWNQPYAPQQYGQPSGFYPPQHATPPAPPQPPESVQPPDEQ